MAEKKSKGSIKGFKSSKEELHTVFYETGNVGLDMAVSDGRGLPKGGVVTLYAGPGAGKSTTCVDVSRRLLTKWRKEGLPYKIVYLDTEKSSDLIADGGLDEFYKDGSFLYKDDLITFDWLQDLCEDILNDNDDMGNVQLIIIDTLQGVVSKQELTNTLEGGDFGTAARLRNRFYKYYLPQLKAMGITCIFISQQRQKQGVTNPYEKTTKSTSTFGDKHYADCMLYFTKSSGADAGTKKKEIKVLTSDATVKLSNYFYTSIQVDEDKNRYGSRGIVKTLMKYGVGTDNWWIIHNLLQTYKHLRNDGSVQKPAWNISEDLNAFSDGSFKENSSKSEMRTWIRHNMTLVKDFLKSRDEYHNMPPIPDDDDDKFGLLDEN